MDKEEEFAEAWKSVIATGERCGTVLRELAELLGRIAQSGDDNATA